MIFKIFPYVIHLQILQQSEYRISSFIKWILNNFTKRKLENKKALQFSLKAKIILSLSIFISLGLILVFTLLFGVLGLVLGLILSTQTYLFLIIATLIFKPIEYFARQRIKNSAIKKLNTFDKLTVIGITGSYGKTSVKEFLYAILKTNFSVLKTPQSYNTVLGISKVIDLELDESYEYFICEMAAYKRGEIKELSQMLKPKHGILTGINEQHLEMFGSLENTTKAKFELIQAIPSNGFSVINLDNKYIKENYEKYNKNYVFYGLGDYDFSAKNIKITEEGSQFDLILNKKIYSCETRLLGKSQIENIVVASALAFKLGMNPVKIVAAIKNIRPVPHRLQPKTINNYFVIDDAYNSNITGFKESLYLLQNFESRTKVIVTPGIVDLGNETLQIHRKLGEVCDEVCDLIILVGKSERTKGLEAGVKNKNKVKSINTIADLWPTLDDMKLEDPVVLMENDLPDNY